MAKNHDPRNFIDPHMMEMIYLLTEMTRLTTRVLLQGIEHGGGGHAIDSEHLAAGRQGLLLAGVTVFKEDVASLRDHHLKWKRLVPLLLQLRKKKRLRKPLQLQRLLLLLVKDLVLLMYSDKE